MIERTFKAMHALGNKFNVKDFHSAVLESWQSSYYSCVETEN